jgi:hypothetical protein
MRWKRWSPGCRQRIRNGDLLRYYAEFSVPEAGYTSSYPPAGTIDLFTTDRLIPVELPVEAGKAR